MVIAILRTYDTPTAVRGVLRRLVRRHGPEPGQGRDRAAPPGASPAPAVHQHGHLGRDRRDRRGAPAASGDTLLDLACGRGGYGLEVAARTDTRLVGVDFSAEAVRQAQRQAELLGRTAGFRVGDLVATGLDDGSVHGVLCIDAVQFAVPPEGTYAELRRVLAPGGRVVLTCWSAGPRRCASAGAAAHRRPRCRAEGGGLRRCRRTRAAGMGRRRARTVDRGRGAEPG